MRKKVQSLIPALLIVFTMSAQGRSLLRYPKCASYDTLQNRYLVTCLALLAASKIVEIDESGQQRIFKTGLGPIISNHIVGDIIYVSYDKGVYAINLNSGNLVANISIPEAQLLTGMASDTSGYLYVSDNALVGKIFRIDLADYSYSSFCLGLSSRTQDVEFDPENNRLVAVGYSQAAQIQTISLPNPVITNITTYPCGPYDGVARDRDGNYYFSCYETRKIFRYDKNLANPVELMSNLPGYPSNIDIDAKNNVLSIPYLENHKMAFVGLDVDFTADTIWAQDSLTVAFQGTTFNGATDWKWDFGDGDSAFGQTVQHTFHSPGCYDITLFGNVGGDSYHMTKSDYVSILADTVGATDVIGYPGKKFEVQINVTNNAPLERLIIPIDYSGSLDLHLDSFTTAGCRTDYFDSCRSTYSDTANHLVEFLLAFSANVGDRLSPGMGPVMTLYITIPFSAVPGTSSIKMGGFEGHQASFIGSSFNYVPVARDNFVSVEWKCGDANNSWTVNILDVSFIINYLYKHGQAPQSLASVDVNHSGGINILDVSYLINYMYKQGLDLNCP
ncbi:hypothetical protein TRIP_C21520 [Candidatus Zixiibacteriota bacterium]|nr:hypothetical protein TRIP_C21520 [candidate division Zixibacteria bacterium]